MTQQVQRVMDEIDKLSPSELNVLRSLLAAIPSETPHLEHSSEEVRAHWQRHFDELEKEWADRPPLKENAVLMMRAEERY